MFQRIIRYFKPLTNYVVKARKSKDLPNKSIKPPATLDNSLNPRLDYFNNSKFRLKFDGNCLKSDGVRFSAKKIISFYITFEMKWFYVENGFKNSLFGAVKLTKNAYPDKHSYSWYGISFDVRGTFSL